MADFQLQDKASTGASRRRFDPWLVGAAVFFVAAAALSAAPALKAGPVTLAGLLLLLGVAGVAVLGLVAIKGSAAGGNDVDQAEGFLDALSEPAALAAADGRLLAANLAWREVMGEQRRLPKGVAGSSLFAALVQARKGEMAQAVLRAGGVDHTAKVSRLAGGRLLIRLTPIVEAAPVAETLTPIAIPERAVPPPSSLDAFAGASPFGAALLEGLEPFKSRVLETNPALTTMTGGKAGVVFGDLIDPASRNEAETRLSEGRAGPFEVRLARDPSRIAHLYLYAPKAAWWPT
jgi:two-component system cell cycle sensor histidine kinase/response regulator CckA